MSGDPIRFLVSFGQAVSTMALYKDGHPARERAVDRSYRCLRDLQEFDPTPRFSFLGEETIYGEFALRELGDWEWGSRLAQAGVQRMELASTVTRDEYEEFLEEMMARITLSAIDSAEAGPRSSTIKFGPSAFGVKRASCKRVSRPKRRSRPRSTLSARKRHRSSGCTTTSASAAACRSPKQRRWCGRCRWRCTASSR